MDEVVTKDIYEIVTNQIIQKLESNVVPWRQPWKELGPPVNLVTKRPYRGINLLLLSSLNYPRNEFVTFKQVKELGGQVNKGEKGHLVVLWLWIDEDETRKMREVEPRKRPLLRYYHVFNVTQCSGIYLPKIVSMPTANPISGCEGIYNGMPNRPKVVHNENEAYYHPIADYINMPRMEMFETAEAYYGVLMHELVHSTGYVDRLNRKELVEPTRFGTDEYSMEELTAEIGSCYLTALAGIEAKGFSNSIAYIQGWLARLRSDKKFIIHASLQAQKAVDFILNHKDVESATKGCKQHSDYEEA